MAKRALHEIMTTRFWDFYPESFRAYRTTLLDNIASHRALEKLDHREDSPYLLYSRDCYTEKTYIGNTNYLNFDKLEPEDKVICVIDVQGPVLRNGDLCSYGSKEHKDIIMRAANDDHTIGFLVLMDSPGGSSMAKYDYQMALEYARSKGKSIVGLIDGMACSAGYALMALCDEIYFTNPHDIVGCIGTMCAMYTLKDGDINTVTQERYAEIYADGSPYKNKDYRDVAEGNYDEMKKELNKFCSDFQKMVKEKRPKVTEEQLMGLVYEAGEVIGTLVDGQGTKEICIARIQSLSEVKDPGKTQSGVGKGKNKQPGDAKETAVEISATYNKQSQTKKQTNMANKNYPFIQSAAGVNALVADESNGIYMVETMADNMENYLMQAKQNESTLAAKLKENAELNTTIEQMKKDHAEALAKVKSGFESVLASLKETHDKALKEADAKLEAANKQLAEKDAEIKELSETTSQQPTPQDHPKDNVLDGIQEDKSFKVRSVCDENLSWEEKYEAKKKREEELRKKGTNI